jgi:tetratricopeptide (TPR) repeat protein
MRSIVPKTLTLLFLFLATLPLSAQKGIEDGSKFGHNEDSVNCRKNLSLYRTYYDQENYEMALDFWRPAFFECPASSANLHLHGITMFKTLYAQTSDKAYIDSMNMVYDARIKYFGREGYNEARRGMDLWSFGQNGDPDLLQASYNSFEKAVELDGRNTDPNTLTLFMGVTQKLFDMGVFNNGDVITNYGKVMDIIEPRIAAANKSADIGARDNIDMIFKAGGAADCDGLINYFTGRIKETPDDVELLKKVLSLLDDASCTESDLYFAAAESLYEHEKSATSAAHLAQMNFDRGQMDRAEHYFKEAISLEEEPTLKSSYYTKLAAIRLSAKDNRAARDFARQAIELNPESGTPYMIIGNAYAGVKVSDDEFENQAVYWVAVDYFQKAKQVDPSLTSNVSEYISTYSGIFPTKTECFFRSITEEGTAYRVGGWINETTTVRFRKES